MDFSEKQAGTPIRPEKHSLTPGRTEEIKETLKPKLDRNQPTIDKLFTTPVRKRKRVTEVSPDDGNTNKKGGVVLLDQGPYDFVLQISVEAGIIFIS